MNEIVFFLNGKAEKTNDDGVAGGVGGVSDKPPPILFLEQDFPENRNLVIIECSNTTPHAQDPRGPRAYPIPWRVCA